MSMNINVNAEVGGLLSYEMLSAKSKPLTGTKLDERKRLSEVSLQLSTEGKAKARSAGSAQTVQSEQSEQTEQTKEVQQEVRTGKAPVVARDLERTGYASIDNTIIDSLNGVSDDIRQYAYDIVRNDFLIDNAGDMSEEERQELISLGLSEAQFIADNYLSGENAEDFMTAIKKVAGIAANATREEDGTMDYGGIYSRNHTENGYTVEITDSIGIIKRFCPDVYKEYKALQKELKETHDTERIVKEVAKLLAGTINELVREQPEAFKQFEKAGLERFEKASENDVKDTFRSVDTKNTKTFIQALMQMKEENGFSIFPSLTNRLNAVIEQWRFLY